MPKRATVARLEALSRGDKTYLTGLPCRRGHNAPRSVADSSCQDCARINRRNYFTRNPEKERERTKLWRTENREAWLASARENSRKRIAAGVVTRKMRHAIAEAQAFRCGACDTALLDRFEVDHRIPISRGGVSNRDNLWALCVPCNVSKGTQTVEEWLPQAA